MEKSPIQLRSITSLLWLKGGKGCRADFVFGDMGVGWLLESVGRRFWVGLWILLALGSRGVEAAEVGGSDALHWSFRPLPSRFEHPLGSSASIDALVRRRLAQEGMEMSGPAEPVDWLRRVTLDLTGLPPRWEEVEQFLKDTGKENRARVVEGLLASPRYAERWAQHWLDVVRYADTHGFEVNTERPNAWPYRDYVIRAFHQDTPYDRFIREQLVGDALGEDAATGFLVTASVLLPGQIGADDASKRLARQDALDEMVVNTTQTFLGLSVGCARCHDHKFDPISAAEYYSMQSFFAGVEYGDRELLTAEIQAKRRAVEPLKAEVKLLDRKLTELEPVAKPRSPVRRTTDAARNVEEFAPLEARFLRFNILDSNLHPTLGWIEPCLDEVEAYEAGVEGRNVALASLGTKVTASGSQESGAHKVMHLIDGRKGNGHSWMSDQRGKGWVLLEFPRPVRVSRFVWGRDGEGKFKDRLPTAFTLEAGLEMAALQRVAGLLPPRSMVKARRNVDRFEPVRTQRVRFTVLKTNRLEPCLDELEVFDVHGNNVALSGRGTRVASSGDTVVADRHELRFIHDGLYGNSRSWMSSSSGTGWVTLEFADTHEVDRVVWGRDREGQFTDRLPTEYRIEVALENGEWRTVADGSDREIYEDNNGAPRDEYVQLGGLPESKAHEAADWMLEKERLEKRIAAESAGQLAFAGIFRKPDEIRLLNRGDPEQPKEEVEPAVLRVLGGKKWPVTTAEQERRRRLADWIADPANPLTARVMVNRIWQGHFGMGLVETANDFGKMGTPPSHPELLDWLAAEFIRAGWSMKHLHRLIVLSETYMQSGRYRAEGAAKDGDARWLWRFPSRRLEAEAIRDSMLWVNGRLDLKMGGRGYDLFNNRGGLSGFVPVESYSGEGLRRMIYAHKVRREREAVFGAFDCPDAGQSSARRRESTTPIQALNLFNSRFTLEQSEALSKRLISEVGDDVQVQVDQAYRRVLCRQARPEELEEAVVFVREHGLPALCRALYNSNEFLFIP